jgi:hypothetical protein
MTKGPSNSSEKQQFIACPYCTIQVAADAPECPHCRKVLIDTGGKEASGSLKAQIDIRTLLGTWDRVEFLRDYWIRYGKWVKVAGPILAAFLLLFLVYGMWVGHKVTIVPNPELPIKVKQGKSEQGMLFTVMVKNMGESVPDLSLKSIGVVVEIVYRDGLREKKTYFPKTEYLGEGAILNGETGSFEIETRSKAVKEIILRSEVVDLGTNRTLIPAGSGRTVPRNR